MPSLAAAARHADVNLRPQTLRTIVRDSSIVLVPGLYIKKDPDGMIAGMTELSAVNKRHDQSAVAGSILRLMKEHDSLSLESLKFLHKSTHQVDSSTAIESHMVSLMAATPMMGTTGSLQAPFRLGAIGGVAGARGARQGAVYYIDRVSSQERVGGISEEDLTRCVLDFEALFLLLFCSEVYQPVVQVQS